MNQKGQGFSVFKLLIAAIVAVFILTIMLQILQGISPPTEGNPNNEASSKIKTLLSALGSPERTGVVSFKPDSPFLRASTIARQTGALVEKQICLDISASFLSSGSFEKSEVGVPAADVIEYRGTSELKAKLFILCDSEGEIERTVEDLGLSSDFPSCETDNTLSPWCFISIVPTN